MIKRFNTTLLLLCCLCAMSKLVHAADKALAEIISVENAGHTMMALSKARQYYQNNTDDLLAQLSYGRLLVKNGKTAAAITLLKPLANENNGDWRPWFWLGSAQLMQQNLQAAAWSMDEALAREGSVVSLWVQRAVIEQELGNYQAAASLLQVADSIHPGHVDVMANYAYALEQLGEYDKALVVYRQFLRQSVASKQAGRLRSKVLGRLAQIEQAKKQAATEMEASTGGANDSATDGVANPAEVSDEEDLTTALSDELADDS